MLELSHVYPPRPVWLSPRQCNQLMGLTFQPETAWVKEIVEAWEAAPIDPADAAHRAVRGMFVGKRGESAALCAIADAMADAALSALGIPDA